MATNFGFPPVQSGEFYFVSYNTQDSGRVGEIAREMNSRGIPLWYDEGLLVGEKWERQIARKIEDCRAVIMFVTKKLMSKENPYVQIEYDMAVGYGKKIYVILLDDVTFSDVTTDLKGWWLRLNKLHGIKVSGKFFARDIVDIMDSHIHFIKAETKPEPIPKTEPISKPVLNPIDHSNKPKSIIGKYKKQMIGVASIFLVVLVIIVAIGLNDTISNNTTSDDTSSDDTSSNDTSLFTYRIINNEVIITGVRDENTTDLTIPSEMEGYPVTDIGISAFSGCTALKSMTIPDSITDIGNYTFYNCTSLESITIPNSITRIGYYAFRNCTSLKSITIPNSVTNIGAYAFEYCTSLESITIPNSVTDIGNGAFCDCSSDLTIYGKSGSYVETYAKEDNIKFVAQ